MQSGTQAPPRYRPDTHNILTQIFCKQQLFIIFLRTNFTKATFYEKNNYTFSLDPGFRGNGICRPYRA